MPSTESVGHYKARDENVIVIDSEASAQIWKATIVKFTPHSKDMKSYLGCRRILTSFINFLQLTNVTKKATGSNPSMSFLA